MSEMIERVAVAISGVDGFLSERQCYDFARAAIGAMREPTEGMVDAVYAHRPTLAVVAGHDLSGDDAKAVFTIMIDAALNEKSPTP